MVSSKEERRECGASRGLLRFFKPPHHQFFRPQCVLHDELYDLGGTEQDRRRADKRLFDDMVRHSIDYFTDRVVSQWWYITLAFLYWVAVRLFGRQCFNFHDS